MGPSELRKLEFVMSFLECGHKKDEALTRTSSSSAAIARLDQIGLNCYRKHRA